jgi:two-component system chemotaxis response regulator CheB
MEPKYPKPPMNIVISNPDGAISLLVDEIGDVMTIEQDYFESVPETFDPRYKSLLEGVFKLDGSLLLLLNLEEAIRTSE